MAEAIAALIGAVVGFALSEGRNWLTRNRQAENYWEAILAEVEFARAKAESLTNDNVAAPLYRLSDVCFYSAFPQLLANGQLSYPESTALMTFFSEVGTLNRGLDRAAESKEEWHLISEHNRNLLKASRLLKGGPIYEAAADALKQHIKRFDK